MDLTIPAAVRRAAELFGDRPAVVEGGTVTDWTGLHALVRDAAAAYLSQGIEPGDRVCIWAPNRLEWMVAALGAQYVGAVLVPLNTRYRGQEAADVLERSRARVLVVAQGFLGTDHVGLLRSAAGPDGLAQLRTVVSLGDRVPGALGWGEFLASAGTAGRARADELAAAVEPGDLADILFTSGTTGRSKGAMAAHRQTLGTAQVWGELAGLGPEDRYLVVNPFFHSFGSKAGYLACLLHGATCLPHAVFDASAVLEVIEAHGVTILPGPPALYQSMLEHPAAAGGLASLRLAVTGGAMVPEVLIARMRDDLGIDTVLTAYGMTEIPVVTMCTPGEDPRTIATTCGPAVPGVSVITADEHGRPVPVGEAGQVLIRGDTVMLGYLDDPDATAKAIDAENWLHTGDVGVLDDRGYLRITDRITDMFTVGGFNVYPAEVEQVLSAHPAIRECAVIGVPDERLGEVPRAFVVARAGLAIDPDEVIAFCRERLANFKVPRSVVTVGELPRNAGGKVLKRELRAPAG